MDKLLVFCKYFSITFCALMIVGFYNGATGNYADVIEDLISTEVSLEYVQNDIVLTAPCHGVTQAAYSVGSHSVLKGLTYRRGGGMHTDPIRHKDVAVSLLGGGSAGISIKSLTGSRNITIWVLAGTIFGTVSGYLVGDRLGEMFALRCGSSIRKGVLENKIKWQEFSRMKYADELSALGFSQEFHGGNVVRKLRNDDERLFYRVEGPALSLEDEIAISLANSRGDSRKSDELVPFMNAPPLFVRCKTKYSTDLAILLDNASNGEFQPTVQDFNKLSRVVAQYRIAIASRYQVEADEMWSKWILNGISEDDFKRRGGLR